MISHDYTAEPLTRGVRWKLPFRQLPRSRHWGWGIFGIGLSGIAFFTAWMALPVSLAMSMWQDATWFAVLLITFGLSGMAGWLPSAKLCCLGLALVCNRTWTEIVLDDQQLTCREHFFMLSYVRRCPHPLNDLQTLHLEAIHADDRTMILGTIPNWLGVWVGTLTATSNQSEAKPFLLGVAYPLELLERFGRALQTYARHLQLQVIKEPHENSPLAALNSGALQRDHSEQLEASSPFPAVALDHPMQSKEEQVPRPADTDITLVRRTDGLTITIPPAGVWRAAKPLVIMSVIWNISTMVAAGVFLFPLFTSGPGAWFLPGFAVFAFLPCSAIGVVLILIAWNMGCRQTTIVTAFDQLLVVRQGLWGKRTWQFRRHEIQQIRVGNSGIEINHKPVKELQFKLATGKVGWLCERREDELRWLAAELSCSAVEHAG